MAIIATLGEITFTVLENGFRQFQLNSNYGYAIHTKLNDKPTLQQVGNPLSRIEMAFMFHGNLTNPEAEITRLRTAAKAKESLSLVFGESYKGNWVVTGIRERPTQVIIDDNDSQIAIATFSMSLLESATVQIRSRAQATNFNPFQFFA